MSYTREKLVFRLSDLKKEPMDWLWPDRIAAGELTLIDGDPGLGKSLLTLDLAARLTTARPLPDGYVPPQPVSVVLVGHQDGLHNTVLPRLEAAQADLSRVHIFAGHDRAGLWSSLPRFPEDCDLLRETVQETGSRLVVLDPLMALLSERFCSLNERTAYGVLGPLAQVAQETRAAMIPVRHLNKGGQGQRALYRGSGSIAISGAARSAFLVGRAPTDDDLCVLACTKTNLAVPPPSLGFRIPRNAQGQAIVVWTGAVDISADELVLTRRTPHGQVLDQAKDFLLQLLKAGACSSEEANRMAHEAGITTRMLRRAREELGVRSEQRCTDDGRQWVWSQPPTVAGQCPELSGERRAEALKAAQEESRRFFEALCERHARSAERRARHPPLSASRSASGGTP